MFLRFYLPSTKDELLSLLLPLDKRSFFTGDKDPVSAIGKLPGLSVKIKILIQVHNQIGKKKKKHVGLFQKKVQCEKIYVYILYNTTLGPVGKATKNTQRIQMKRHGRSSV